MFENVVKFLKKFNKKEKNVVNNSKDAAKERLHLVLMQDRANVSADFLELMKQEIIEVIKKYIEVDENAIDVRLTNKENEDGTNGAPALYANIPILNIKNEARKIEKKDDKQNQENKKQSNNEKMNENKENTSKKEKNLDNKETANQKSENKSKESNSKTENKPEEKNSKADKEKKETNNNKTNNLVNNEENNNTEQEQKDKTKNEENKEIKNQNNIKEKVNNEKKEKIKTEE